MATKLTGKQINEILDSMDADIRGVNTSSQDLAERINIKLGKGARNQRSLDSLAVIETRSTCKVCGVTVGFKNTRMIFGYLPTDHTNGRNRTPIWFYTCHPCFEKCSDFRYIVNFDDAIDWHRLRFENKKSVEDPIERFCELAEEYPESNVLQYFKDVFNKHTNSIPNPATPPAPTPSLDQEGYDLYGTSSELMSEFNLDAGEALELAKGIKNQSLDLEKRYSIPTPAICKYDLDEYYDAQFDYCWLPEDMREPIMNTLSYKFYRLSRELKKFWAISKKSLPFTGNKKSAKNLEISSKKEKTSD